jgi:putative ABC transport system permease protein
MIRNYLKTAFRSLRRHKGYTIINILGLAFGLCAYMLISAYVHFEKSFDRMHAGGADIYRVESRFYKGDQLVNDWATSTNGYAHAMKDNFPEIASFTRINWHEAERVVRYKNVKFREDHVCFADSNFFHFFSYPLVKGDPRTALQEVNTVVLSETAARKYFGNEDPMGKSLDISTIGSAYHCMVTGVFKDLPPNSTMQFSFLISWATTPQWMKTTWYLHESYTFLKLIPGSDVHALEAKFPALAERYKDGPALKDLTWAIRLVPLWDIHLNAAKQYEVETKGDRRAVQFLTGIGLFILLIACVNYINLSTAKGVERAREVGIRKVSGARRWQLVGQFLLESFLMAGMALLLSVVLVAGLAHSVFRLIGLHIPPGYLFDPWLCAKVLFVFAICIIGSGLYPAQLLASLRPITVLKGRYSFSRKGVLFRKTLVVFQFVLSVLLIAGTLAVYRQIRYMDQEDLGVRIDQTLVLKAPVRAEGYAQKAVVFKDDLLAIPGVVGVTGSGAVPGREVGEFLANRRVGAPKEAERTYEMLKIDHDFMRLYNLTLVAGRAFDLKRPSDSMGLVLNESAVTAFGFASPSAAIGQKIWLEVNPGRPDEVIGVVRDYHQQSLQQAYTPVILFMDPAYSWIPTNYYSVKVNTRSMKGIVAQVTDTWSRLFPESSFDYFFLDDFYDRQYQSERQFAKVFGWFSALAIVIACMGLFGLTAYTVARRTKEIGVRKVLGASAPRITRLLTWEAVRLMLLAGVVALPLAYLMIVKWMESYAFRAELTWWQFALPVALLVVITLATTAYLTVRAALTNPTTALREE